MLWVWPLKKKKRNTGVPWWPNGYESSIVTVVAGVTADVGLIPGLGTFKNKKEEGRKKERKRERKKERKERERNEGRKGKEYIYIYFGKFYKKM